MTHAAPLLSLKVISVILANKLQRFKMLKLPIAIMEEIQIESRLQLSFMLWAYAMRMFNDFRKEG